MWKIHLPKSKPSAFHTVQEVQWSMLLKRHDLIYDRSIAKSHRLWIHLNKFLPHPRDYVTKVEIDNPKKSPCTFKSYASIYWGGGGGGRGKIPGHGSRLILICQNIMATGYGNADTNPRDHNGSDQCVLHLINNLFAVSFESVRILENTFREF